MVHTGLRRAYAPNYEARKGETDPYASFERLSLSLITPGFTSACLFGDSLQSGML